MCSGKAVTASVYASMSKLPESVIDPIGEWATRNKCTKWVQASDAGRADTALIPDPGLCSAESAGRIRAVCLH